MTGDVRAMRGNKKRKDGRKLAGGRIRKADKGPRKGSREGRWDKRGRGGEREEGIGYIGGGIEQLLVKEVRTADRQKRGRLGGRLSKPR